MQCAIVHLICSTVSKWQKPSQPTKHNSSFTQLNGVPKFGQNDTGTASSRASADVQMQTINKLDIHCLPPMYSGIVSKRLIVEILSPHDSHNQCSLLVFYD